MEHLWARGSGHMTAGSPLVLWLGLAGLLGAAAMSIVLALSWSRLMPWIGRVAPARRARLLTALG